MNNNSHFENEASEKNTAGFAGTLKQIQLIDLIQMCSMASMSMAISVEKEEEKGTIVIENGEIVHAVSGKTTGENAFYKILGWQSGSFETLGAVHISTPTIERNSQYLLMEATRLSDEKASKNKSTILEAPLPSSEEENKIRVLVVDDSTMMCKILSSILEEDDDIIVAGTAKNGKEALGLIKELKPDLITLDVNMPVMDGTTTLKHIMISSPCPVIIISNPGASSQVNIIDFLRLGAVDFITKPKKTGDIKRQHKRIISSVKLASGAGITGVKRVKPLNIISKDGKTLKELCPCKSLIIIKSGAGGFSDLTRLMSQIPGDCNSGIAVFQSMPEEFTEPFASYMNDRCHTVVQPVCDSAELLKGLCCIGTDETVFTTELNKKDEPPDMVKLSAVTGKTENTDTCCDSFNSFLQTVSGVFHKKLLVVLLSGAECISLSSLKTVKENGGTIVVHSTSNPGISEFLENVLYENTANRESDINELKEMIALWEKN